MKLLRIIFLVLLIGISGFGIVWARGNFSAQIDETRSVSLVGNRPTPDGFARADGSHVWDFPTDFGPHPDYQTEWWYYTGNLATMDDRRFGYQLTIFRRGLIPALKVEARDSNWGANQVYMGHFAISDIYEEDHYAFERFSREGAGLAGAQAQPFKVWLENWEIHRGIDGDWVIRADQDNIGIDLILKDEKGITFHGKDGYSQKGPEIGNASYYFSQTRLHSGGVVTINNQQFEVEGLSWMDHEFSTSALSSGQVGWDWFSLQLDNGTDLMIAQLRRDNGEVDPFSSGTVIKSNGESIDLRQEHFRIQVEDFWRSPHTGATYPAAWKIEVPQIDLVVEITPLMSDQEMNVSYAYWEGAVDLQGIQEGQYVSGSGYVELTGYAASMEGEF
jgi:predicted secreted hydrolase